MRCAEWGSMASMKSLPCRDLCVVLLALAAIGAASAVKMDAQTLAASEPAPKLTEPRVFVFDRLPIRTMANGGESRDITHGVLATGETLNLHESTQVVGAAPNPMHVIQHSEFILVRDGTLEFQHEDAAGKVVTETVGPGGVILVAFGTKHTVRNIGNVPAKYFVIAIGGDAK
jgi:mannose-6-phosphate isomerase-like protein (cupin superfamily)